MVNRLKTLKPQFKRILKLSSRIAGRFGFKIYLVGGVVRDLLLDKPVFDLDIAVEADAIPFVRKLSAGLGAEFRRHHSFGTATLYYEGKKIDFATTRREKYFHSGALPKVEASSLKDDLFRRDFTINAMAIDLNKNNYGKLIDFYGGFSDLGQKRIKILHPESFLDDPLRILRAVRFQQRFSFTLEPKTYRLMTQAIGAGALGRVNPHRLRSELILFLSEPRPYKYIKCFYFREGFKFIDKRVNLGKKDFKFFIRAQQAVSFYKKKFIRQRKIKFWLVYLAGIILNLPKDKIFEISQRFGFKKDERKTINLIKSDFTKIIKLDKKIMPSLVYKGLYLYSFETILFFYAYFSRKRLRRNIRLFFADLARLKLKIRGKDLKKIGVASSSFMGRLLQKLFYLKLDKNLKTKKQEMEAAKRILKNHQ